MSKVLHLTLKKKWFDMVSDPNPETRKDEEYRECKEYWAKRLVRRIVTYNSVNCINGIGYVNEYETFDAVCFHHGYRKGHPTTTREFKGIDIGPAKPEWSDNWQGDVFRIKLGDILSTTNH